MSTVRRTTVTLNGSSASTTPVDIDALIVAEREATGERAPLQWRGRVWELPWDIPVHGADLMQMGRITDGLAAFLGEDVRALDPPVGVKEAEFVLDAITTIYGIPVGNSSRS